MGNSIIEYFTKEDIELIQKMNFKTEVTADSVLQLAKPRLRELLDNAVEKLLLDSSEFRNKENLDAFLTAVNSGKKGIIFVEHYSNLDYPILLNLMKKSGQSGTELEKKCLAIAGLKLSEDNPYVAACASAYDRIYIYPSRSIKAIKDLKEQEIQVQRSKAINLASIRELEKAKKEGKVIVVFPAGTRYRPGKPETKKGVKEIASYIKMFDIMLLVSINGNCLRLSESGNMQEDLAYRDRIILDASPVIDCKEFRKEVYEKIVTEDTDKKQAVVDRVMEILEEMHNKNEVGRL